MRLPVLTVVLLCACGRTAGYQSPDPSRPPMQQQGLAVDASADFVFCFCHHGVGPGFHGDVTVNLSNASEAEHRLFVARLEVESAGRVYRTTTSRVNGWVLQPDGKRKPVSDFAVAAHGSATFVANPLSAYFDGPQNFADVEGADLLRVVLSVDGKEEAHESRELVMRKEP